MGKNVSFGMNLLSPKIAIADRALKAYFMLVHLMGRNTKRRLTTKEIQALTWGL